MLIMPQVLFEDQLIGFTIPVQHFPRGGCALMTGTGCRLREMGLPMQVLSVFAGP